MKKSNVVIVLTIYSLILGGYLYYKGGQDKVNRYKHSRNMQLTLASQYRFGFNDGYDACKAELTK